MKRLIEAEDYLLERLTRTERLVYDAIVINIGNLRDKNITILSEEYHCSPATFISLLKKLGYASFSEFKVTLSHYQPYPKSSLSDLVISRNIAEFTAAVVDIDVTIVEKCADKISQSKSVIIIAFHITRYSAEEFAYRLIMLGFNVIIVDSEKTLKYKLKNSFQSDYIMLLTLSGNLHRLDKVLDESNIKLDLVITANRHSQICNYADQVLIVKKYDPLPINNDFDIMCRLPIGFALKVISDLIIAKRVQ